MRPLDPREIARGVLLGVYDPAHPHVREALRAYHGMREPMLRRRALPVRFRAKTAVGKDGSVSGIAAAYGVRYGIGAGREEVIEPHAFRRSVIERPVVPVFREHVWTEPIASAVLQDEDHALTFETSEFYNTETARAWRAAVREGAIEGVSIGFLPRTIRQEERGRLDVIEDAECLEVSLVVRQANPGAVVTQVA